MPIRNRSRQVSLPGGRNKHTSESTWKTSTFRPFSATMMDYIGKLHLPGGGLVSSPMRLDEIHRFPCILNGTTSLGFQYDGYTIPQDRVHEPGLTGWIEQGQPARLAHNAFLVTELLAATNPYRPEFSVPVAIKELAELGGLFKLAARTFAGYVGSAYLNYRFGWSQFHRDIQKLSKLTQIVERRVKEFNRLIETGGISRTMWLDGERSYTSGTNLTRHSAFSTIVTFDRVTPKYLKISGHVKWAVDPSGWIPSDELEVFNSTLKRVLDLGPIDPQTAWELIPFSWLADYFVNISSILGANAGRYKVIPYDICIMWEFQTTDKYDMKSKPASITATDSSFRRLIRSRDLASASSFPVISPGLLSWSEWKVVLALLASFKR